MPNITTTDEFAGKAQETLARQVGRLNDRKRARRFQDDLLVLIRNGRKDKNKYGVNALNLSDEQFVVAVDGDVLVADKDVAKAAPVLSHAGFHRAPTLSRSTTAASVPPSIEELNRRVVRYAKSSASAADAASVVDDLLDLDVQASVNYVLPLGYVVKGEGGFEPTKVDAPAGPGAGPGTGVRVAVIDTGIAPKRGDGWLVNIKRTARNEDDLYQVPPGPLLNFAAGHGTFVAGIIQQIAPGAKISVYRAIGSDGIGNDVDVAEAILLAAHEGAQIINLSLGTAARGKERPVATRVAMQILAKEHPDVLVVASAGNSPDTKPFYPASFDGVQSVASLRANLKPSEWSSRGGTVDFSAVGEGVVSTYVEGKESPAVDKDAPDDFTRPSWALGTGTSFAAPQVVGEIARRMAQPPGLTAQQACDQLKASGTPIADYGIALRILPGTPR